MVDEPEIRQLRAGQIVGGHAPAGGFIVDVSTRDLLSDAASNALIDWLRGVVLTRFARDQNRRIVLNFTDGAEFHHHPEAAANADHTCAAWVLSGRVMREEEAHKFVDRYLQVYALYTPEKTA